MMIKSILIGFFTIFSWALSYAQDHDYIVDKGLISVYNPLSKQQIKEVENLISEILLNVESKTELDCKVFVTFSNQYLTKSSRREVKKIIRKIRTRFGKDKFEIQEANPGESVLCKLGVVIG